MATFTTTPRKWGNSIGITIPREIVQEQQIAPDKPLVVDIPQQDTEFWKLFGTLKTKKGTQEALDEVDKEFDKDVFR